MEEKEPIPDEAVYLAAVMACLIAGRSAVDASEHAREVLALFKKNFPS